MYSFLPLKLKHLCDTSPLIHLSKPTQAAYSLYTMKLSVLLNDHDLRHHFSQRLLIPLIGFQTKLLLGGIGDIEAYRAPCEGAETDYEACARREVAEGSI